MKTKFFTILFFISIALSAQEFTGKAIYKTSRKSSFNFGDQNNMTDEMKENLKKRIAKMNQKTYILNFNRHESTYREDIPLEGPSKPNVGSGNVFVMSVGGGADRILYKNLKEERVAEKTDIQGKTFLIKDALTKHDWVMTGETKNIGKYTCYKATYETESESRNISMTSFGSSNNSDDREVKDEKKMEKITVTAWYTLDIPLSNGPENYGGLPGLILEVNDGTTTTICTEIVLNPEKKIEIKEPKKGKVVNREKFAEISEKKTKEMLERFKARNGININGVEIRSRNN